MTQFSSPCLSGYPHHPVTSKINVSPEQGKCPKFFKQTHLTHQKSSLDKEEFKNYRPVSKFNLFQRLVKGK